MLVPHTERASWRKGSPTEAAWDLGRRSAELLLDLHLQQEGEPLRQLALSVWGTSTMRNGGEDIAQALALDAHLQDLGPVALAVAVGAAQVNVGEELHLHMLEA